MKRQNKITNILKKKNKVPIVCLTAYSKVLAKIADKYCDIILVGDSLGMVLYGMNSTREVKLNTMINHAKTVKKFAKKTLVVVDMPHRTYSNKSSALKNAKKLIKETKCDAVKLEGGKKISKIIKHLVSKNISVMGHIGLLPQTSKNFKFKGKNYSEQKLIFEDALSISKSGAFAMVIECVVENIAEKITKNIKIPTIGIGASKYCDGQILVTDDLLGFSDLSPKFVKKYSNLKKIIESSINKYAKDVKNGSFPSIKHSYR